MKDTRIKKKITINLPIEKVEKFVEIISRHGYNITTYFKEHITEVIAIEKSKKA